MERITQFALDIAAARIAAITTPARTGGNTPVAAIVKIPSVTPGNKDLAATPIQEQRAPMIMTKIPPRMQPRLAVLYILNQNRNCQNRHSYSNDHSLNHIRQHHTPHSTDGTIDQDSHRSDRHTCPKRNTKSGQNTACS